MHTRLDRSVLEELAYGAYAYNDLHRDINKWFNSHYTLDRWALQCLYRFSALMRRIVEELPNDATSKGLAPLQLGADGDEELPDTFAEYWKDLGVMQAFRQRDIWARLFGGGSIFIVADDGKRLVEPLDMEAIETIRGLVPFDCWELRPEPLTGNAKPLEFHYYPARYSQKHQLMQPATRIHHSRVLYQVGAPVTRWDYTRLPGVGDSVLQAPFNAFFRYVRALDSSSKLLKNAEFIKHTMNGLVDLVRLGKSEEVQKHMSTVYEVLDTMGVLLLDGDREDSDRSSTQAGVGELVETARQDFTAESGLPYYKLWGTVGESGLSDSGGAEREAWNEAIRQHQQECYQRDLERLAHISFAAQDGPTEGEEPEEWAISFAPLDVPDEKEEAELREIYSRIDSTNITSGIYDADEARQRYIGTEFNTELVLEERGEGEGEEGEGEFTMPAGLGAPEQSAEAEPVEPAAGEEVAATEVTTDAVKKFDTADTRVLLEDFSELLRDLEDDRIEQIEGVLGEAFERVLERLRDRYDSWPDMSDTSPIQQTKFAEDIRILLTYLDPESEERLKEEYAQAISDSQEVGIDRGESVLAQFGEEVVPAGIDPEYVVTATDAAYRVLEQSQESFTERGAQTISSLMQLGTPVNQIADALTEEFESVSQSKARMLVRNISSEASNSATESRYRDAGIEYVQVYAIDDHRTSAICLARNYNVYRIGEVRLPFHPHCRTSLSSWRDEYVEAGLADPEFYKQDRQLAIEESGKQPDYGVSPSEKYRGETEPPVPVRTFR